MSHRQKYEFVVDICDMKQIIDVKDRVQNIFDVTIADGSIVVEDGKQWIEVMGRSDDCKKAKECILALCSPKEETYIRYPEELASAIANKELQDRIEKQFLVILRFTEPGKISISGSDSVLLTQAYSALEDIIDQHMKDKSNESPGKQTVAGKPKIRKTPDDTINDIIMEAINTGESNKSCLHVASAPSSKTSEDTAPLHDTVRQMKKIGITGSHASNLKYLKEYALKRGFSEKKVDRILATHGNDIKFDTFFRALNGINGELKDEHLLSSESTASAACHVDSSSDPVSTILSEDICLKEKQLKLRNEERQQLLLEKHLKPKIPQNIPLPRPAEISCGYRSRSPLGERSTDRWAPLQQARLLNPEQLRHVVIDGSNVAMAHGNGKLFSCRGIQIVVNYFKKRGHKDITAFVPQTRTQTSALKDILDQHLLAILKEQGILVFTPARKIPIQSAPGAPTRVRTIVCYDDRFVIDLAHKVDGVIVSNDNYRDMWRERPEWRETIENRLLMFSFVGDLFMPPEDPLGLNGPSLDEFLRKPSYQAASRNTRWQTGQNVTVYPSCVVNPCTRTGIQNSATSHQPNIWKQAQNPKNKPYKS